MGTMKTVPPKISMASSPSTSLVASATKLGKAGAMQVQSVSGRDKEWQQRAYNMYDEIGEFRYACDWVGSMMSKAILVATQKVNGVVTPLTQGTAADLVEQLFNDDDGKAEMLRLIGVHMTIAGECFLVGYDNKDPFGDEDYVWQVASPTSIRRSGGNTGKWSVNSVEINENPDDVLVIRMWRQHPTDSRLAVAPSKALLPVLGEILRLTQHVAAQVDSRLAGAGILLIPSEITFPPPPETNAGNGAPAATHHANDAESLMVVIQQAMSESIKDRASASALVPIVITAPGEAITNVKHMTFWSELDRQSIDLRNEAIRRLALGMDMPPEVLQGTADMNHWSSWQADESAIKAHTEPLLKIITSSLAQGYLRPLLRAAGVDDLRSFSINADTSEMRLRPNRSKEALELYDRGALSEETLRRETGFGPEDGMDRDQRAQWFRLKVASGSTTPELVENALVELGVIKKSAAPQQDTDERVQESRPTPSLKGHPETGTPDEHRNAQKRESRQRVAQNSLALTAAADQIAIRAFERAGNKLKNTMKVKPAVAAAELYSFIELDDMQAASLLDDAWAHLPPVAERYGVDPKWLQKALHEYAVECMTTQTPHAIEQLAAHLEKWVSKEEMSLEQV